MTNSYLITAMRDKNFFGKKKSKNLQDNTVSKR